MVDQQDECPICYSTIRSDNYLKDNESKDSDSTEDLYSEEATIGSDGVSKEDVERDSDIEEGLSVFQVNESREGEEGASGVMEMMTAVAACKNVHRFCRACLLQHCSIAIQDHTVPIPCPFQGCKEYVEDETITLLFEQEGSKNTPITQPNELTKYGTLRSLNKDDSLLMCNECFRSCQDVPGHVVTCECGHYFCRKHGDKVHAPTQSCSDFDRVGERQLKRKRQELLSLRKVSQTTKPCSHCQAPITKVGGCSHMTCTSCKGEFCWSCGTHIHMRGGFCRKCKPYLMERGMLCIRCLILTAFLILLPLFVAYVAVALLLTVLTLGCLCRAFTSEESRERIALIVFFPFVVFLAMLQGFPLED